MADNDAPPPPPPIDATQFSEWLIAHELDPDIVTDIERVLLSVKMTAYVSPEVTAEAERMNLPELTGLLRHLNTLRRESQDPGRLIMEIDWLFARKSDWGKGTMPYLPQGERVRADKATLTVPEPASQPVVPRLIQRSRRLSDNPEVRSRSLLELEQWVTHNQSTRGRVPVGWSKSFSFWFSVKGKDSPISGPSVLDSAVRRYVMRGATRVLKRHGKVR